MLTLTDTAVEALDAVVESAPVSDAAGVRISRQVGADGQPGLAITLVEMPDPSDQMVDTGEQHVPLFVEQEAAAELDDKVLDAEVQEGQVGFLVATQS
jgi:iron-sulfur cluster assembly protein